MDKFDKRGVQFNAKLLKKLRKTEKSGVEIHNKIQHLAIHPCQLKNFKKSLTDLLNEKVAKYSNAFNGILLGYQHIKLLQDGGVIHDDSCYIHFDIQADFFVFKPEIGKIMKGVINRKSNDHLGVLVYEAFNVSIPIYDEDESGLGSNINIGDQVTFQILYINLTSVLPYIRGKLISDPLDSNSEDNSNDIPKEEIPNTEELKTPKKKKKKEKKIKIAVIGENF